jgi:hypothetical protein
MQLHELTLGSLPSSQRMTLLSPSLQLQVEYVKFIDIDHQIK